MITANSWYLEQEAKQVGAYPIFKYTISPHFFDNGIDSLGSFFNTTYNSSLDRIEVLSTPDEHAGTWISAVLQTSLEYDQYPTSVVVTCDFTSSGYGATLYYRTERTETDLTSKVWTELTSGDTIDLYEYYQFRIVWTSKKCWTFPDISHSDPYNTHAYAANAATSNFVGVAVDGDCNTYLSDMVLTGIYEVDPAEIIEGGELSLDRPIDFSDIVASDFTLLLSNKTKKYSPRKSNFIFLGTTKWFRKNLNIKMTYKNNQGNQSDDWIDLFDGYIMSWGPITRAINEDGSFEPHTIELYSRDKSVTLLEKKIGVPNDDGTLNTLCYGEFLAEAESIADLPFDDPYKEINFNSGNYFEGWSVDTVNNGAVSLTTSNTFEGAYCLSTSVATANQQAYIKVLTYSASSEIFCSFYINFATIPSTDLIADRVLNFFSILDSTGTAIASLIVGTSTDAGKVWLSCNGEWIESDWNIYQDEGVWKRVSVWMYLTKPSRVVVWVEGDEVLRYDRVSGGSGDTPLDLSASSIYSCRFGLTLVTSDQTYLVKYDDIKYYTKYNDNSYFVSGYPFSEMSTLYVDNIKQTKNFELKASKGLVTFTSFTSSHLEYIDGTINVRVRKDSTTHPVDIIQDLLTQAGLTSSIDSTSFVAARAANPSDIIGARFDDMSIGEAVLEVCGRCLYDVYVENGMVKIKAYTGVQTGTAATAFTSDNAINIVQTIDMGNVLNTITGYYANYERDKKSFYRSVDQDSVDLIDVTDEEIDMQWGEPVVTDSRDTLVSKVDLLATRLGNSVELVELGSDLSMARLELGDLVTLNEEYITDGAVTYEVFGKILKLGPPFTSVFKLIKFLGES